MPDMNIQIYFIHVNQFYSKLIRVCFRILVQLLILTEAVTVVLRKLVSKYTNIDESGFISAISAPVFSCSYSLLSLLRNKK